MNRLKWMTVGFIFGLCGVGVAGFGTGFFAPAVDDKANVYDPETGAIVYDKSDESFYGNTHTNQWIKLRGDKDTEFLTAESPAKVAPSSGIYIQMTSNSVTLTPGSWRLSGTALFAGAAGFTYVQAAWSSSNGTDSTSAPGGADIQANIRYRDIYPASSGSHNVNLGVPVTRMTVTADTDVYLVPYAQMATPANSSIRTWIYAERLD